MTPETRGNPAMFKAAVVCLLAGFAIFFVATTVQCQERKGMGLALSAMGIGQALDTVSTIGALNRGAVEANPIYGARPSPAKLIVGKLPLIGVGWLLTKIAPKHPKLAQGTAYVIGGIGAGLAVHNSRQGRTR